jgi:hypothetical protein
MVDARTPEAITVVPPSTHAKASEEDVMYRIGPSPASTLIDTTRFSRINVVTLTAGSLTICPVPISVWMPTIR